MDGRGKNQDSKDCLTNELLQAMLVAPEERKRTALKVLRGEAMDDGRQECSTEPYITLREAGRRLHISPCSLWRWGVPGHDLGGRRRFRISEVQSYLESDAFRKRAEELKAERRREQEGNHG